MFKLSKESQRTFYGLLSIPIFWIVLNHFGFLDYLKIKTLDWRMNWPRGEISHRTATNAEDDVSVENNQSVPRIPKVTYVNFDAKTLEMPGVGERPWPRDFFRNVAQVLIERGNARVVAFDFLFSPKSASKMVPDENVHQSDGAVGQLVAAYPDRVVLGAGYTGVQTMLMKAPEISANPPLFKDGFDEERIAVDGKYPYPEAPTYPMQNFKDGEYFGRIGSITVIPYRSVDNVPRWVPLWFPGGGKAQAYNVLGGKRQKLALDFREANAAEIKELESGLSSLVTKREDAEKELAKLTGMLGSFTGEKSVLEQKLAGLKAGLGEALKGKSLANPKQAPEDSVEAEKLKAQILELDEAIGNFRKTLKANPALAAVVGPQLKARESERSEFAAKLEKLQGTKEKVPSVDPAEVEKLKAQIAELDESIGNFKKTLEANPAIASVVGPQLKARETERSELAAKLEELKGMQEEVPTADPAKVKKLKAQIAELDEAIGNFKKTLEANPAIAAVVGPQLKARESERTDLMAKLKKLQGTKEEVPTADPAEVEKLKAQIAELDESIGNFKKTLEANPAIAAVVGPQLKARETERTDLMAKLEKLEGTTDTEPKQKAKLVVDEKLVASLRGEIDELENAVAALVGRLAGMAASVAKGEEKLKESQAIEDATRERLVRFRPQVGDTELLETQDRLRLVYKRALGDDGNGSLVESLPNEMPLNRDRRFYTLGLEALLAYYGVGDEAVTISDDKKFLRIVSDDGENLVSAPLSDSQFVEVNWFSKWSERIPEVVSLREARRLFGDERFEEYVALSSDILRSFLSRVKDIEEPKKDADLLDSLAGLGIEQDHISVAGQLLQAAAGKLDAEKAPAFEELRRLTVAIEYFFLPASLESPLNPMCGMKDVLDFDRYLDQRETDLENIDAMLGKIETQFIPKIRAVLKQQPENEAALVKMKEVRSALETNKSERKKVLKDLELFNSFFAKFDDAIAFIGPEEKTFQDLAPTPFDSSAVPKVSVHGNLVKMLTSGLYLKRLPDWVDHVTTAGLCLLMAFLAVYSGPKSSWVQVGGVCLQGGYVILAFFAFSKTHVLWPVTAPACAGLSTTFVGLGVMLIIEQKAKGRLKGMFGSYVSSDLVDQMVESGEEPHLGGEETQITAYFSDVQAFSSFSELLGPTGLVDLMNEYLTAMTNILQEERGTLDKYIGDAIVAMYGAPIPMDDHAYQSVRTALLMQARQLELREKWAGEEEKWGACHQLVSQMQTRIGCNTGTATVGNMGALDRFNYTMMGDMVNLAARCESGAKAYGAYIMITEETKDASIVTKDDIAFRYLDKIIVKGRTQPVAMYEPTGFMADLTQETEDCLDCFEQGVEKYLGQDWNGALKMFEKAKELEPNKPGVTPGVKDNPSIILIDRCKIMKDNPPGDDWDGVYVMTTK